MYENPKARLAREIVEKYRDAIDARTLVAVWFRNVDESGQASTSRVVLVPEGDYVAWRDGRRADPPEVVFATEPLGLGAGQDVAYHMTRQGLGKFYRLGTDLGEERLARILAEHARQPQTTSECSFCGAPRDRSSKTCRYCGTAR